MTNRNDRDDHKKPRETAQVTVGGETYSGVTIFRDGPVLEFVTSTGDRITTTEPYRIVRREQ